MSPDTQPPGQDNRDSESPPENKSPALPAAPSQGQLPPPRGDAHQSKRALFKVLLPLAVVLCAVAIALLLVKSKPEVEKTTAKESAVLVNVLSATQQVHPLSVQTHGTVIPSRRLQLHSQLAGKVVAVHAELVPGGVVREGARLVQIERADYLLALQQSQAQLQQAQAQLVLEQGRQEVAQQEWQLFKQQFGPSAQRSALALREPQLASARAQLQRAEAALRQAQLQLARSAITAPFDAMVIHESVAKGQQVQPQQRIAELAGVEQFWVRVAVPPHKLRTVNIPKSEQGAGALAEVRFDLGQAEHRYPGRVIRMEGALDQRSRLAQLIVAVDDPLGLSQTAPAGGHSQSLDSEDFPLLLDAYVEVVIDGGRLEAVAVPRKAIRNGRQVYLYEDGKLRIRSVEIIWEREQEVLVSEGIKEGDLIITSDFAAPVEGMALRVEKPQSREQETAVSGGNAQ